MINDSKKQSILFLLKSAKTHRRIIGLIMVLIFVGIGTELLKPWPLKFVIDFLTAGKIGARGFGLHLPAAVTESTVSFLIFIGCSILLIAAIDGIVAYFSTYFQRKVGGEIIMRLRSQLFAHIQRLSLQFHYGRRTGELVNRVTNDTGYLQTVFSESFSALAKGSLQILGMAAIMLWMDWQMMLMALILAPFLFWITIIFTGKIKQAARQQRHREGNLASIAQETISSIELVKAYSRENFTDEMFENESSANLSASLNTVSVEAKYLPVVQVVTSFGVVVVICFGVFRVQAGVLTAGDLWIFLSYLKAFYRPLKDLSKQLRRLAKGYVRWEKVMQLLQIEEAGERLHSKQAPQFRGEIEFENVHFGYSEDSRILTGLNLKINAGEKIIIVGATGSGKSTLVSLLAMLHEPSSGVVRIDGHDISNFTAASVRDQISYVLQQTLIFRTSIRENIAYGRLDATLAEIVSAAKKAKIHDFIDNLPDGYDTVVGERGATLSGGQRQRLSIARAILRQSRILILDEPTTGLDPNTEKQVWEQLHTLMKNRTTIVISHQPNLALDMDRIFHLENGRLRQVDCTVAEFHHYNQTGVPVEQRN